MKTLDWDHNAYYHRLLLRHLPHPCGQVLDVGCGAGTFAVKLAMRADHVDAVDVSPAMIDLARQVAPANVSCTLADVLTEPLPGARYDAVVSICALHHMPLTEALPRLAQALRPGGVLVAVALPRIDLLRDLPIEVAAGLLHRLLGVIFALLRAADQGRRRGQGQGQGQGRLFAKESHHDLMPVVLNPPLTTRQVRDQASSVLPGVKVRRLIFWRYFLLWQKPRDITQS